MISVKGQLAEKQVGLVYIVKTIFTGNINIWEEVTQWRSKSLRGAGSSVTWGPPFPSPPLPPPSPSPPSFSPLPQPSPSPCRKAASKSSKGVWGALLAPPAGSGADPQSKSNLVHFSLKIRHLVATIVMIVLRVLPKIFLWPHYSGAPRSSGAPVHWTAMSFLRHWSDLSSHFWLLFFSHWLLETHIPLHCHPEYWWGHSDWCPHQPKYWWGYVPGIPAGLTPMA